MLFCPLLFVIRHLLLSHTLCLLISDIPLRVEPTEISQQIERCCLVKKRRVYRNSKTQQH